jgi:hypothetical protein
VKCEFPKAPLESVANPANPGSVRISESDFEPSQAFLAFLYTNRRLKTLTTLMEYPPPPPGILALRAFSRGAPELVRGEHPSLPL